MKEECQEDGGPGSHEELGSSNQERGVANCVHEAICVLVED